MQNRIHATREILKKEGLDALLISSSLNIAYLTDFTGFDFYERGGYALLTKTKIYLFVNSLYTEDAKQQAKETDVIALTRDQKLIPSIQKIVYREKIKSIGFEDNLTVSEYKVFKKLKGVKLKLADEVVEEVRQIKDESELTSLKKACQLTDKAYSYVLKNIQSNMTELEVAWEIEKFIKENRGELAFPTIVAFGKNSATPHHKTDNTKLTSNSIVLLDFGAKIDGYCADMTRTFFFGKADAKFKKMYETVLQAQELPLLRFNLNHAQTRLNLTPHNIDKLARDFIIKKAYPPIPHSVGHGIGLEVHELPHISPGFTEKIQPKTPFTIEPGIYLPEYGGVRIEDTVYFNGEKIISLTNSPKELLEI